MYFVSKNKLDKLVLTPRIPDNFLTKNGYEDNKIKRVCFAPTIDDCLIALSANIKNNILYVYEPDGKYDTYSPTVNEVPDSSITHEIWIKEPVTVKFVGTIKVGEAYGKPLSYNYGNNSAELYRWRWKWMNKSLNESYSKDFNDVMQIVNSLPKNELNLICNGNFKNSPFVKYREVMKINNEPVAFIDVYTLPNMKSDRGVIVLATKHGDEYRRKGYVRTLCERLLDYNKKSKKFKTLVWPTNKNNLASRNLAKSLGFYLYDEENCPDDTLEYTLGESYDDKLDDLKKIVKIIYDYRTKKKQSNNCQLCTLSVELQMRGQNILPRAINTPRDIMFDNDNYIAFKNYKKVKCPREVKSFVRETVSRAGDGSRFIMDVGWLGSRSGHVFNVININDSIWIVDSTDNIVRLINENDDEYLDHVDYKRCFITRVDNLNIDNNKLKYTDSKYAIPWKDGDEKLLQESVSIPTENAKLKVGIDIDDTINDFNKYICEYGLDWCIKHGKNIDAINKTYASPKSMFNLTDEEYEEFSKDLIRSEYRFTHDKLAENADLVIEYIKSKCYVKIITSRSEETDHPNIKELTTQWLANNGIVYNNIVFGIQNKGKYCKDNNISILIDDNVEHINSCAAEGILPICIAKPYNTILANSPNCKYCANWLKVKDVIDEYINNRATTMTESVSLNVNTPEELLEWMDKNIKYDHDDNTWTFRSPERVYRERRGDCHDQSAFEDYFFNRMRIDHGRLFMIEYKDNKKPWYEQECGSTHTILYFIRDNKYYWFENAWQNERGIHGPYDSLKSLQNELESKWEFEHGCKYLIFMPYRHVDFESDLETYILNQIPDDKERSNAIKMMSELDESTMSIANLSPIITNGLFEELDESRSSEDFDSQIEKFKENMTESTTETAPVDDSEYYLLDDSPTQYSLQYCPETLSERGDSSCRNRVKRDIITNTAITANISNHHGVLYATSDFHIYGIWHRFDANQNFNNIDDVNKVIEDINNTVGKDDTLVICGDIGWKKDLNLRENTEYFLTSLNCRHIIVVVGNHDLLSNQDYYDCGVEMVCDRLNYGKLIFTHYPIDCPGFINIHGHIHEDEPDKYDNINLDHKIKVDYHTNHGVVRVSDKIGEMYNNGDVDKEFTINDQTLYESATRVLNEEAVYDADHKYPLYIVLMHTGTDFSNFIKTFAHGDYTHAAISLSPSLDPLYEFNETGFHPLRINSGFFDVRRDTKYAVYVVLLTRKEYSIIIKNLDWFIANREKLKYNFVGAFLGFFKINKISDYKYFCSSFVAKMLSTVKHLDKKWGTYLPMDITNLDFITCINKGDDIRRYDPKISNKNLQHIRDGKYDKILTETSYSDSMTVFGDGVRSAVSDGEIDMTNEDADGAYDPIFSPRNTKPGPSYIDSTDNFETNETGGELHVDMQNAPDTDDSGISPTQVFDAYKSSLIPTD